MPAPTVAPVPWGLVQAGAIVLWRDGRWLEILARPSATLVWARDVAKPDVLARLELSPSDVAALVRERELIEILRPLGARRLEA